jgi:carbon-monoxide dehydrogenase medium subunit
MLPKFEYRSFKELEKALAYLAEHRDGVRPIAGGTDLVVQMRAGKLRPRYLADIEEVKELQYIEEDGECVRIGALTKMESIRRSPTIRKNAYNLWLASQSFATWQVRNIATIGGNLCNASPASDTATPLMSLKAEVKLRSIAGERTIPLERFFTGPGMTVARPEELLTEIIIPKPKEDVGLNFMKLGRRTAHVLSIVNVAVSVKLTDGMIQDVIVALGSVAPKPVRALSVENELKGKEVSEESLKRASGKVVNDINPISDVRATREYRLDMSKVLTFRALKEVV